MSDMEDFDYLNGTLHEWLDEFQWGDDPVDRIQDEYLPRFEAAIYRNITDKMAGRVL